MVVTINGDVIEIVLTDTGSTKTVKAQRMNSIVRLSARSLRALTLLAQAEQTIMIGGDNGIVCSYDISTHELIDVWNVG